MATLVPSVVGPLAGAAYSTMQAWEDAFPSDLPAAGIRPICELQNTEHVYTSAPLSIGYLTVTDSDCYPVVTTVAGGSFLNHPDIATNPLRYDASKGAAIKHTGTSGWGITIGAPYTKIHGIQILITGTSSSAGGAITTTGTISNSVDINQCILESAGRSGNNGTLSLRGSGSMIRNSLVVQRSTAATTAIATLSTGASAYNTVFVSLGTTVTDGLKTLYAPGTIKNCYVGGALNPHDGGSAMTFSNCFSDVATANFSLAPLSTATFVNVTDGTHDFRTPTGSALRNAGITDVTTGATDIYGTSRPQGAAYDVGAWEAPAAFIPPELVIGWTEANDSHAAVVDVEINGVAMSIGWTEGSDTHGAVLAVDTASGQLTTGVICNNNNIPRANLPNCAINIYHPTTGALVLRKTGLTTNAEGRLVVLDPALAKATAYAYEPDLSAAGFGRRLPVGTTV